MQQKKTYKITGLFVIFGLLCFGGIIAYYASNKFALDKKDLVVMYFEESVRGLSVGSSVVLNGVEVGKVVRIRLIPNLEDGTFKTPVFVTFNVFKRKDAFSKGYSDVLRHLIEKGLRARLISANYLTGQLMIELRMDPSEPAVMRGSGNYMEIPTEISSFAMLSKDLQEVPLGEILSRLGNILSDIDENLPTIMTNVNKVMENVSGVSENISHITTKIDKVMDKKNGETTKTMNNFNNTLEEITKASRSLKNLTDYLERHPEAIIQGKEE